jgi:hypothetical protein
LYRHANHAVAGQRYRIGVLNEARAKLNDPRGLDLFKLATEQAEVKRVQWGYSTPAEVRSGEVPAAFDTSARFVIICNSWPLGNPDVDAIQSRGTMLYFCPSAAEMHRYAKEWYVGRPEVYDFLGEHLAGCEEPDLCCYKGANDKAEWGGQGHLAAPPGAVLAGRGRDPGLRRGVRQPPQGPAGQVTDHGLRPRARPRIPTPGRPE